MATPLKWTNAKKDDLKARLLVACKAILAEGGYPSFRVLSGHFPEAHKTLVHGLRDELCEEGELDLGVAGSTDTARVGLNGRTPEERAEADARRLMVLAEKVARGERPVPALDAQPYRIQRCADFRYRENRR